MLFSINELQSKVDEMILKIGFPRLSINLCDSPVGDGTPYISFENKEYNYVYSERGCEFSRKVTDSSDELLYWIMSDFSHKIAFQYELEHRIEGKDVRRIAFPKFIELMAEINPVWKIKAENEISKILATAPYDDKPYSAL